ncbi:hypothetical protein BCR34DRAFT_23396 [Clohesyomyces aquaticus]|uniref:Uncharacterized protein n=1 Tax=Clohesyomyces aquaticus TaxID=1231657 RepID=A0A1Y2A5Q2_9PLEO|nr:hypothetical protein BCR34DRAFT_23396 [Clohesyomyces aquaticus]
MPIHLRGIGCLLVESMTRGDRRGTSGGLRRRRFRVRWSTRKIYSSGVQRIAKRAPHPLANTDQWLAKISRWMAAGWIQPPPRPFHHTVMVGCRHGLIAAKALEVCVTFSPILPRRCVGLAVCSELSRLSNPVLHIQALILHHFRFARRSATGSRSSISNISLQENSLLGAQPSGSKYFLLVMRC